jgi:hypothetical protein
MKKFTLCFLLLASLLFIAGTFETAAQEEKKPDSNKTEIDKLWIKQRDKAMEKRNAPVGVSPRGVVVPKELGASIVKQQAKLAEMKKNGFAMPLDYAGLAGLYLKGEFVEIPLATETFYLEVGSLIGDDPLTSFDFDNGAAVLKPSDAKYLMLKKLADDFGGTKYDLENPAERKQFKLRLFRMIAPAAKTILEELAADYQKQFNRPLRITAMARSIEYQVDLNKVNAGSFLVRDKDSLPAHASGLAFDIGYKHLTAEEQNFLMSRMAKLEKDGKIDGLRETGVNSTLHVFVYADGLAPKI